MSDTSSGILFVVATPIGNLDDLTPRARQTLAAVSLIAAEDTRHTERLLLSFGCRTRLMALHDHNEANVLSKVIDILKSGNSVALVSDAGTPLVSDPGFRLVREARANDIGVSPIPGPSALIAALSSAGLPTDRFCFEGFTPSKSAARKACFDSLANESRTIVFYESVHRIVDCIAAMCESFGADRPAFIGREMTKMHEQCVQDSLGNLQRMIADGSIVRKGEFVVIIAGQRSETASSVDADRLLTELSKHLPAREVARIAASVTGEKKNAMYERLLQLRKTC